MRRALVLLLCAACAAPDPAPPAQAVGRAVTTRGYHEGPAVYYDPSGPRRFVEPLLAAWDSARAWDVLAAVDRHPREPGNEGYEAAIDLVLDGLRDAGFGERDGLDLEVLEGEPTPTWTPRSAELALVDGRGRREVLLAFRAPHEPARTMLPVHAPSFELQGVPFTTDPEAVSAGVALVTDRPLAEVLGRAADRGAAAVLSSALMDVNVDPSGGAEHEDAIGYRSVRRGTTTPVLQISPRVGRRLAQAAQRGDGATLDLAAHALVGEARVRTVVATLVGEERPGEVVAVVAHVQEPGADDNASGVAGVLEAARDLARLVAAGEVPRPRRSLAFVWGVEYGASRVFLEHEKRTVVAGFSGDMLGASRERTGGICLLERTPDPGALQPLPPDRHTAWGAGEVRPEDLAPNGLAVVARCALVDVGIALGGWTTSEHPFEGGSDHEVFLRRGIPAVLFWHFPEFTYHTGLDRLDRVDPEELRRTSVALVGAAAAVADARPHDLKRYAESALRERYERLGAVVEAEAGDELGQRWADWGSGARRWLAALCNGEPAVPPR